MSNFEVALTGPMRLCGANVLSVLSNTTTS